MTRAPSYITIYISSDSTLHLTRPSPSCSPRLYLELLLGASNALHDLVVARNYNKYYDLKLDPSDHELLYAIILDTPAQRRRPILSY